VGNYILSRDTKAISSEFMEVSAMNPKVVNKKIETNCFHIFLSSCNKSMTKQGHIAH